MRFFLPFWPSDRIFKNFDPWKDSWYGDYSYIWKTYTDPPLDGILISRINLEKHKKIAESIKHSDIHQFLGFKGIIMGDCGAFGYIDQTEPPYDPIETLKFYRDFNFDIGVTVDHLIVPATYDQKEFRWNLTIENAKKMFDTAQKSEYSNLRLLGVAQGWDIESYKKAVKELVEYGFDYVGIGGLVRRPTYFIEKLLFEIGKLLKNFKNVRKRRVDVHLFGITRETLLPLMMRVGISSFDSATFLRRAWIAASDNYYINGKAYTAIRFPIAKEEHAQKKEGEVFRALSLFERGEISVEELLKIFEAYDPERVKKFKSEYKRTLEEKPWERCECDICKSIGIHVCIFRMSERNMRRGFHNVYQFYKKFRNMFPKIFAFTSCTAKKNGNPDPIPAFQRYLPSPIFKVFWENIFDLPIEIGVLSAKFGLIEWHRRIPYYDYKMQESDVPKFVEELKEKLKRYDKIFFIGLGLYREVVEKVKQEMGYNIEIFPKEELTEREKIDIIEYTKQMKLFREKIIEAIPENCRPFEEIQTRSQITLEKFLETSKE